MHLDLEGYNVKVTVCRSAGKKCRSTFQDRDYIMLNYWFWNLLSHKVHQISHETLHTINVD